MEPDSCALAALAARRALHLVAACLHVPAVHAHMLEESGLLQPPTTSQMMMVSGAAHDGNVSPICFSPACRSKLSLLDLLGSIFRSEGDLCMLHARRKYKSIALLTFGSIHTAFF